jgi:hypothetical protein
MEILYKWRVFFMVLMGKSSIHGELAKMHVSLPDAFCGSLWTMLKLKVL